MSWDSCNTHHSTQKSKFFKFLSIFTVWSFGSNSLRTDLNNCSCPPSLSISGNFLKERERETMEILRWTHVARTEKQDVRRSGKEDAKHTLCWEEWLFELYAEHNSQNRMGSFRDITWRGLLWTWRLIRDWSYLLAFRVSLETLARPEYLKWIQVKKNNYQINTFRRRFYIETDTTRKQKTIRTHNKLYLERTVGTWQK